MTSPTLSQAELREAVARIIKRAVYEGGFVEEHTDAILRAVSSTKGGGDQGSVASGLTPLVASCEAARVTATPSEGRR